MQILYFSSPKDEPVALKRAQLMWIRLFTSDSLTGMVPIVLVEDRPQLIDWQIDGDVLDLDWLITFSGNPIRWRMAKGRCFYHVMFVTLYTWLLQVAVVWDNNCFEQPLIALHVRSYSVISFCYLRLPLKLIFVYLYKFILLFSSDVLYPVLSWL